MMRRATRTPSGTDALTGDDKPPEPHTTKSQTSLATDYNVQVGNAILTATMGAVVWVQSKSIGLVCIAVALLQLTATFVLFLYVALANDRAKAGAKRNWSIAVMAFSMATLIGAFLSLLIVYSIRTPHLEE
jgi:hypothetical protein